MEKNLGIPVKVTIDLSYLIDNDLTADIFLLLHWKYHNNYELPPRIVDLHLEDAQTLEYLQSKEFIKITGDKEYELRQKAIDIFEVSSPEQKWLEFLGKFPMKVPNSSGGTRALKIANPESKGNEKIKKKYINLIKNNPNLHKTIIEVLEAEIKMRRDSGQLQYMNAMEAWLNQANYDKYAYLLEEQVSNHEEEDYL